MTLDAVWKKIGRYLKKEDAGSLVVNVQNKRDLDAIVTRYNLPQNNFIHASDSQFCKADEFPSTASLLNFLAKGSGNYFVCEVASFFRLQGEVALQQILRELLFLNITGHVVILTYQCAALLASMIKSDRRLEARICLVDGDKDELPKLVFTVKDLKSAEPDKNVVGIEQIPRAVEAGIAGELYVETKKARKNFPHSLYSISEMKNAYEILCKKDNKTAALAKGVGSDDDWQDALAEFQEYASWEQLIFVKIGDIHHLDRGISHYQYNRSDKRWLWYYFIGLKLFGAPMDKYLHSVAQQSETVADFVSNIFLAILDFLPSSKEFAALYGRRKELLNAIGNPAEEVAHYCRLVLSKERDALYYLTDNTLQEKQCFFRLLDKYALDYERSELLAIIERVYPALGNYLNPYRFKNNLLDNYFQEYKYQKVINKILPEFMDVVERQAVARDYNTLLQPRSSVVERLDSENAQTYFTDAMGVEYLGFIMAKCHDLKLMAKVTVCRSELPSITSRNKEFWNVLSTEQYPIIPFDKIDKIKHHGEEGYDYSRPDGKLPIHLIRELELIDDLLEKIRLHLVNGAYSKAILISDHGASRLAVIHETENLLEMELNGQHSGRCCPKSAIDEKPDNATDADDFWALANYDRFKGSRKANVEVHGGATLEEVVVPIIELSCLPAAVEVKLMPAEAGRTFVGVPEILVSYRKKAAIKIFATQKLLDVSVRIDGHEYEARAIDDNFYIIEAMPEIRRAKTYEVDVYAGGNKIASALPLIVKKESGSEKSIL